MKKTCFMKYMTFLAMAIVTMACSPSGYSQSQSETPPNIILLIGDGMGVSEVTTGFYFGEGPSVFTRFHHIGLQQTSSAKEKVTDSAASGTAIATGTKTYNGAIGVDTTLTPHQSIAELTASKGWSTGVIATSTITHATPASFYAHVFNRGMEDQIAAQLLDSEIDFFAGEVWPGSLPGPIPPTCCLWLPKRVSWLTPPNWPQPEP
jgi:alkaline phosphatase